MRIAIVEMICGIILTGIIPPFFIIAEKNQKRDDRWKTYDAEQEDSAMERLIFSITVFFVIASILIQQNANLLFGIIMGSSLFQLLVLNGISRITSERKYLFTDNYQGGKYLIFVVVLLLFLSADYLLTGKTNNNMISRTDGIILIAVYLIFHFSMHKIRKTDKENFIHRRVKKENRKSRGSREITKNAEDRKDTENRVNEHFREKRRRGIINAIILLIIALGAYFLTAGIGRLAIEISQSQYFAGVLFGGIAVNISSGILLSIESNEPTKYGKQTIENVLLVNTFLLGCTVLVREIRISQYMIYALMLFALVTILMEGLKKIDNRLAGSGMVTVYIGIIIYIILHH